VSEDQNLRDDTGEELIRQRRINEVPITLEGTPFFLLTPEDCNMKMKDISIVKSSREELH